jgi:hypothetical protein
MVILPPAEIVPAAEDQLPAAEDPLALSDSNPA